MVYYLSVDMVDFCFEIHYTTRYDSSTTGYDVKYNSQAGKFTGKYEQINPGVVVSASPSPSAPAGEYKLSIDQIKFEFVINFADPYTQHNPSYDQKYNSQSGQYTPAYGCL